MHKIRMTTGLAALATASMLVAVVAGQPQHRSATLDDILQELRSLRADLADQSSASLRVQALVARVSLQEQRLKALSQQASDAAAAAASTTRARESQEQQLAELDTLVGRDDLPPSMTPDMLEGEIELVKRELERLQAREMAENAQRDELAGLLLAEESRWIELNERLDAVERALPTIR